MDSLVSDPRANINDYIISSKGFGILNNAGNIVT